MRSPTRRLPLPVSVLWTSGSCTRRPLIGFEEVSDEVDVATVRDPLESVHLVQVHVLPDEIVICRVLPGLGVSFVNWITFVLVFFPVLFAALRRMQVEEEALRLAFSKDYAECTNKTKRLLPGIY